MESLTAILVFWMRALLHRRGVGAANARYTYSRTSDPASIKQKMKGLNLTALALALATPAVVGGTLNKDYIVSFDNDAPWSVVGSAIDAVKAAVCLR